MSNALKDRRDERTDSVDPDTLEELEKSYDSPSYEEEDGVAPAEPVDDEEAKTPFKFSKEGIKHHFSQEGFKDRHANKVLNFINGKGKKKYVIAGGLLGSVGTILLAAALLMALIGPWQTVHYSTVLRSIGLLRFGYDMKRVNARVIFNAAVLTNESKGSFDLDKRSITQAMRGVNPDKALAKLGREGTLKFRFDQNSTWGGLKKTSAFSYIEVRGADGNPRRIAVSDFTKGRTYDSLSAREKMFVQQQFADATKTALHEKLAMESRSFRSSTYEGLRQGTGIRMTKWADKARKYFGKSPVEASKLNIQETVKNVRGDAPKVRSSSSEINQDADDYDKRLQEAAETGKSPGEVRSKYAERVKLMGKLSDAVFVTTAACIVHDLANSFHEADKNKEVQSLRLGHDSLTTADQIKSGEVAPEAVGAEDKRWSGASKAVAYREAVGDSVTSTKQLASVPSIKGSSTFRDIIIATDTIMFEPIGGDILSLLGLGSEKKLNDIGCGIILNQYVQYAIAGTELVVTIASAGTTKGVVAGIKVAIESSLKLAGTIGLGELLGTLIENSIKEYANAGFSGYEAHENLYNTSAVGIDHLQQAGTRQAAFGAPMSDEDVQQVQKSAMAEMRAENSQKPFNERYFALDNPFSLASRLAISIPTTMTDLANTVRSGFASVTNLFSPQGFGQLALAMPGNRALAGTSTVIQSSKFGVEQWGLTNKEYDRITTDPAFSIENLDKFVIPRYDELHEKYMPCYAYLLQSARPEQCTKAFLTTDEALKWRTFMSMRCAAQMQASDALTNEGCQPDPEVPVEEDSSGTGTYNGDAKELAKQVLANKNIKFTTGFAATDMQNTMNGRGISDCGGVSGLNPTMLKLLLKASEKYRIYIGYFVTQHGCDGGQHPKGRAFDVDSIAKNGGTAYNARADSQNGSNAALSREFMSDIAKMMHELMPSGGGGLGQRGCPALSGMGVPSGVLFFPDECNHLHLDVRGAP